MALRANTPRQEEVQRSGGRRCSISPTSDGTSQYLLAKEIPPRTNILGDGIIALGQLTTIVGQGGTDHVGNRQGYER